MERAENTNIGHFINKILKKTFIVDGIFFEKLTRFRNVVISNVNAGNWKLVDARNSV